MPIIMFLKQPDHVPHPSSNYCLPCIMASLLFTYPQPLLGAMKSVGSHGQLATAIYHGGDSLLLWILRVYEVITMCHGVCWGLQSAVLSKHKLY